MSSEIDQNNERKNEDEFKKQAQEYLNKFLENKIHKDSRKEESPLKEKEILEKQTKLQKSRKEEEEIRTQKLLNDQTQDEIDLRRTFSYMIYSLIIFWLIPVIIILFLEGYENTFTLSENIILTLLGTTTIQVIGLLYIVLKYLFNRTKNNHSSNLIQKLFRK